MSRRGLYDSTWLLRFALALTYCAAFPVLLGAQTSPSTHYQFCALYLFNFAKYTDWPTEAFADSAAPFVLGILGEDPFGKDIEIIQGKSVKNRKLVVKYFTNIQEASHCHILFVSASEKNKIGEILKHLDKTAILTVSEIDGFLEQGGMVSLAVEKKRLIFEMNQAAAEKAGLKPDARLLQLAKAVRK